MTIVLPLGVLSTQEGPGYAVMALLADGLMEMRVGKSWAEAAQALAGRLTGPVRCDEALTTVGRRHGWTVGAPGEAALVGRAILALSLSLELPPEWVNEVEALIVAWREFYPLRLWEQLPPEMALPLLRTTGGEVTRHLVSLLGQAKVEFGVALYLRPDDFDTLFSGGKPKGGLVSVLADEDDALLRTAFAPLGVPAPILTAATGMRPRPPTLDELKLAIGAMRLLCGVPTGQIHTVLGPSDALEFERTAPAPAARKKAKLTVAKAPAMALAKPKARAAKVVARPKAKKASRTK